MFDWYHTQGSLVVNTPYYTKRIKGIFGDEERVAKQINETINN